MLSVAPRADSVCATWFADLVCSSAGSEASSSGVESVYGDIDASSRRKDAWMQVVCTVVSTLLGNRSAVHLLSRVGATTSVVANMERWGRTGGLNTVP